MTNVKNNEPQKDFKQIYNDHRIISQLNKKGNHKEITQCPSQIT